VFPFIAFFDKSFALITLHFSVPQKIAILITISENDYESEMTLEHPLYLVQKPPSKILFLSPLTSSHNLVCGILEILVGQHIV
jgi:hypothetical protein